MIYPTRRQIVDELQGLSRLAKSRDLSSMNFQLNVLADRIDGLIEKVGASVDLEKAESEGES